jgi:hypothetical protein
MGEGRRFAAGALCALALGFAACSKGGAAAPPDGGDVGAPAMLTCQQVRMCVFDCADDACVAACAAKGSPAAKTDFEALRACTAKTCSTGDVTCACGEQCMADGACLHEADVCLGTASTDLICDSLCA